MLVRVEFLGIAYLLRNRNGNYLAVEETRGMRFRPPLLRSESEGVLVLARNLAFLRYVLGSLRLRVDTILALHERIHETPTDGRIVDLRRTAERRISLPHHERSPRHALYATCDDEVHLTALDRPCRASNRIHA